MLGMLDPGDVSSQSEFSFQQVLKIWIEPLPSHSRVYLPQQAQLVSRKLSLLVHPGGKKRQQLWR